MATLSAHQILVGLPDGWDGSIYRRPDAGGALSFPVVHAANFALPATRGDYGGGAVELMGPQSIFMSLFEFHPESAAQPLFSSVGMPGPLEPSWFRPEALQRIVKGQAGCQRFFQSADRAFVLYVVLGSVANRTVLASEANAVLSSIRIDAVPA